MRFPAQPAELHASRTALTPLRGLRVHSGAELGWGGEGDLQLHRGEIKAGDEEKKGGPRAVIAAPAPRASGASTNCQHYQHRSALGSVYWRFCFNRPSVYKNTAVSKGAVNVLHLWLQGIYKLRIHIPSPSPGAALVTAGSCVPGSRDGGSGERSGAGRCGGSSSSSSSAGSSRCEPTGAPGRAPPARRC